MASHENNRDFLIRTYGVPFRLWEIECNDDVILATAKRGGEWAKSSSVITEINELTAKLDAALARIKELEEANGKA